MRILVNGLTGWIGHYLAEYLHAFYPEFELLGLCRKLPPTKIERLNSLIQIQSNLQCAKILSDLRPDVFINLGRGEAEDDFIAHQDSIEALNSFGGHYAFASSFNACDGQLLHSHLEDEPPNAHSHYGVFKGRCEEALKSNSHSFTVFRFAATHGWASNRISRTEEFLQRLVGGKSVRVARGIFQNRTFVGDLAGMIADLSVGRIQGVCNLGTEDGSDEVDFLRMLAVGFGYDASFVEEEGSNSVNAFMVPRRIYEVFGNKWRLVESNTVDRVVLSPELQKYRSQI